MTVKPATSLKCIGFMLVFICSLLLDCAVSVSFAVSPRYQVIIQKNPFDPERGAGKEEGDGQGAASEANEFTKKYAVYGVVIAGKSRYAFLKPVTRARSRDKDGDGLRKITIGDLVDGWEVSDIKNEGVFFTGAGKRVFLKVFGTTKSERTSNKPVAIATPKPKIFRPLPATGSTGRGDERRSKPEVFVFPNGKDAKKINNPFLKALMDARKKSQRQKDKNNNSR